MKKISLVIAIVIISVQCITAQEDIKLSSPNLFYTFLNNQMNAYSISGMSISIVKKGEIVWKSNHGIANREENYEVKDSTQFILYSLTKTFTGIGLMQLYSQGFFELDDPINDYLPIEIKHPIFPNTPITFRMLMTHTSGIKDNFTVIDNLTTYNQDTQMSIDTFIVNYLLPDGVYYDANSSFTNHEPGTNFSYSNVGATLAGYLISIISGQSYESYITEKILIPLGMNNTKFKLSDMNYSHLANEYSVSGTTFSPIGNKTSPLSPAGFLYSNLVDMTKYLQMMLNYGDYQGNTIIDSSLFVEMTTIFNPIIAPNSGYFFGYDSENNVWGHSGGSNGVKTLAFCNKEEDWGIVVLSNGGGEPWQIAYMMYQHAKDFLKLEPIKINIHDFNQNSIIESNENVMLEMKIRNNSLINYDNTDVYLSCNDSNTIIQIDSVRIYQLNSYDTLNYNIDFSFVTNYTDSKKIDFKLTFIQHENVIDTFSFPIYVGITDVMIVSDEEHLYKNKTKALNYYIDGIVNKGKTYSVYDINLFNVPNINLLTQYHSVFWFTGLDNPNFHTIISSAEENLIVDYLDANGNFLLCSQNASEKLASSSFLTNYLKCEHVTATWSGPKIVNGLNGSLIGNEFTFNLTGGDGSNNSYSPSSINAINGGSLEFKVISTEEGAGVSYNGDYKLVFLPFCISTINNQGNRFLLIERILNFFDNQLQTIETNKNSSFELKIFQNHENEICLVSDKEIKSIEMYNVLGQKIYEGNFNSNNISINAGQIRKGVYLFKIASSSHTKIAKFNIY